MHFYLCRDWIWTALGRGAVLGGAASAGWAIPWKESGVKSSSQQCWKGHSENEHIGPEGVEWGSPEQPITVSTPVTDRTISSSHPSTPLMSGGS